MVRNVLGALLLIMLTAGGGFWYWTTTPQYSLEQLKEAVRDHDLSKFQLYFSTDQVAESMVKDMLASPQIRKVLGGEMLERALSSGMVSEGTVQHEVASSIANDVKMLVRTGNFPEPTGGSFDKVSMGSLDQRLGIRTLSLKKIQDIKVSGNLATVTLALHNEKFKTDLQLTGELESRDGYWQATRLTNIVEFFQRLFDLEANTKSRENASSP